MPSSQVGHLIMGVMPLLMAAASDRLKSAIRAPPLDKAFEDAEQDVGVEAAFVRLVQHDDRVAAQLMVLQHLPQQRAICGRQTWKT